jgi:hypothetical protein
MVKEGKSLERTKGSGGHNKIITDNFLNDLHCKIEADPSRSIRKLAKDLNVSRMTVLRAVGQLGLKSYVRRRRQLLSESSKQQQAGTWQDLDQSAQEEAKVHCPGLLRQEELDSGPS